MVYLVNVNCFILAKDQLNNEKHSYIIVTKLKYSFEKVLNYYEIKIYKYY